MEVEIEIAPSRVLGLSEHTHFWQMVGRTAGWQV